MDLKLLSMDRDAAVHAVISDPDLTIWQFNGRYLHGIKLDELRRHVSIVEVIDLCRGKIPELFSKQQLQAGKVNISVDLTLLIDSQVPRYLRDYVGGTLKEPLQSEMLTLLSWYAKERTLSFQPAFSLMEQLSGGHNHDYYGVEIVKNALLLSGLDREAFLRSGEIKLSLTRFGGQVVKPLVSSIRP